MPEFGAGGPGFLPSMIPRVDAMCAAYSQARAAYFVVELDTSVIAGAGMAQLAGGDDDTCELRKMYMLPEARGRGIKSSSCWTCRSMQRVVRRYRICYIETLASMTAARHLYVKNGFVQRSSPLGATGHFGCDCWYTLEL